MLDNPILKRFEDESFLDYHVRLFANKDEYGIDSFAIADLLNAEYGSAYSESKWRKDYAAYVYWKDYIMNKNLDKEIIDKYEEVRIESEKEKIRKRDQKREYGRLIANQARFEAIKDDVYSAILQLEKKKPLSFSPQFNENGGKHGLALFSDWHYGMEVSNTTNVFNKKVFNQRVENLVEKIIEYGRINKIDTLHVGQLGDLISGSIHVSTRVQSNEDVIEQIKYVSEILAEVLSKLANEFPFIKYYNVIGNHGRTIGNKHDASIKENFEYLIPWFLEARLRDFDNIEIITDQDGYITTKIFNEEIVLVHGNYDRVDQCVTKLPQILGYVPSYIIGGHIHHNYEKEYGRTTVVTNGCLIGADDYSMQGRYGAKPSQKFLVFSEDGLESTYIIKLK